MFENIFISAGHSTNKNRDRGAGNNKYVEGILTAEARKILHECLLKEGVPSNKIIIDGDDTILSDTIKNFQSKVTNSSLLIDLHFNAANGVARGTEVLIPENFTPQELEIADRISDIFGNVLGTPERGIKGRTDGVKDEGESNRGKLGWMRLKGINILIEVEFLDNMNAMKVYDEKKQECWSLVAKYLKGNLK